MDNESDILLVDTHSEGNRGNDYLNINRIVFCRTKFIETVKFTNGWENVWPKNFILKKVGGDDIQFRCLREFTEEVHVTQTVSIPFEITTPLNPGKYSLKLRLGYEGENTVFGDTICINITSKLDNIYNLEKIETNK